MALLVSALLGAGLSVHHIVDRPSSRVGVLLLVSPGPAFYLLVLEDDEGGDKKNEE